MRFSRRRRRMVGRTYEQAASIFDLQMKCAADLALHRPDLLAHDNDARKRLADPAKNGSTSPGVSPPQKGLAG